MPAPAPPEGAEAHPPAPSVTAQAEPLYEQNCKPEPGDFAAFRPGIRAKPLSCKARSDDIRRREAGHAFGFAGDPFMRSRIYVGEKLFFDLNVAECVSASMRSVVLRD